MGGPEWKPNPVLLGGITCPKSPSAAAWSADCPVEPEESAFTNRLTTIATASQGSVQSHSDTLL